MLGPHVNDYQAPNADVIASTLASFDRAGLPGSLWDTIAANDHVHRTGKASTARLFWQQYEAQFAVFSLAWRDSHYLHPTHCRLLCSLPKSRVGCETDTWPGFFSPAAQVACSAVVYSLLLLTWSAIPEASSPVPPSAITDSRLVPGLSPSV